MTVGPIVYYTPTLAERRQIADGPPAVTGLIGRLLHHTTTGGTTQTTGVNIAPNQQLPMIVVTVDPTSKISGHVFLPTHDTLYVTGVAEGTAPGQYTPSPLAGV